MVVSPRSLLTTALVAAQLVACVPRSQRVENCEKGLAVSCGDGLCEASRGEDAATCPADCVPAKIKSYNAQAICDGVEQVYEPVDGADVQRIVQEAAAAGKHVRAIGRRHTANTMLCTDGVAVSTARMNRVLGLETFEGYETVVTEPGIRLGDLTTWLDRHDRSLGFAVMGTRDPTVAGAVATGSHGSSPRHDAVISNIVQSLTVVTADGQLREFSEKTTDPDTWRALRASLGMLGIVVRMRLRVQPQFNLAVNVTYMTQDEVLGVGLLKSIEDCDYGQFNWFPGMRQFVRTCGVITTDPAERGATNRLLKPSIPKGIARRAERSLQYGACHPSFNCRTLERIRYWQFKATPPFYHLDTKGIERSGHRVIGRSNMMMSSELTTAEEGLFQMDYEIAVPASRVDAALVALARHFEVNDVCLPLVGVFIRFARAEDSTLIAHTVAQGSFTAGEPVVFLEIPTFVPVGMNSDELQRYVRPYQDFARLLIEQFDGRPHWAKNHEWMFPLAQGLGRYGDNFTRFQSVVDALDPEGRFANEYGATIGLHWKAGGPAPAGAHPSSLPVTGPESAPRGPAPAAPPSP